MAIVVVDYGMGNLRSVGKAFERVGADVRVSADPRDAASARALVLPGVGAFGAAMTNLERAGWIEPLMRHVEAERPLIGICLGLQLLFDESDEFGARRGLGILPGRVRAFPAPARGSAGSGSAGSEGAVAPSVPVAKVPHMGWNQLTVVNPSPLLPALASGAWVYFVHSYYAEPHEPTDVVATSEHGLRFAAVVGRGSVVACQFHPEKSQRVGLELLASFVRSTGCASS